MVAQTLEKHGTSWGGGKGGNAWHDGGSSADGANGGGCVVIYCETLNGNGTINASGATGWDVYWCCCGSRRWRYCFCFR